MKIPEPTIIGNAKLYLGDCLDILSTLDKVDAVITDPPYGMGLNTNYQRFNGWNGKGKKYDQFNDNERFNVLPFLDIAPICLFWGAQFFCKDLPESGGWLVFNKRGEGKPSSGFFGDCELAWCNKSKAVRMYSEMWHGVARWSSEGAYHPTQKSIGLMKWCIEQAGNPKIIFDPFMGSGTTGVAAVQMDRKFIGIEREQKYFDIACERIDNAQKQTKLF